MDSSRRWWLNHEAATAVLKVLKSQAWCGSAAPETVSIRRRSGLGARPRLRRFDRQPRGIAAEQPQFIAHRKRR